MYILRFRFLCFQCPETVSITCSRNKEIPVSFDWNAVVILKTLTSASIKRLTMIYPEYGVLCSSHMRLPRGYFRYRYLHMDRQWEALYTKWPDTFSGNWRTIYSGLTRFYGHLCKKIRQHKRLQNNNFHCPTSPTKPHEPLQNFDAMTVCTRLSSRNEPRALIVKMTSVFHWYSFQ